MDETPGGGDAPARGAAGAHAHARTGDRRRRRRRGRLPLYGALDLGTNNCRLLIAHPTRNGFKVIDAFSRIVRLGEGLGHTGRLSETAMDRAVNALKVCNRKINRLNVGRTRLIATEACRTADNGADFLERVHRETDLRLEIIDRETEAKLAVAGSASLLDHQCSHALVFDIGGGSTELMWIRLANGGYEIGAWISLNVGVVNLAERHGGIEVTDETYAAMRREIEAPLAAFCESHGLREVFANGAAHMLGTSGTVTTIAGVVLELERYERSRIDGCWLSGTQIRDVSSQLLAMSHEQRIASPCIGRERADLVLAGCAIADAILDRWPCRRIRVADRGLREGMLTMLMEEDGRFAGGNGGRPGAGGRGRRRNRNRRRSGPRPPQPTHDSQ